MLRIQATVLIELRFTTVNGANGATYVEHGTMNSEPEPTPMDHGVFLHVGGAPLFRISEPSVFLSQSNGSRAAVRVVQNDMSVFLFRFHSDVIRCALQRCGRAGTPGAGTWLAFVSSLVQVRGVS